jgi:hypothetical protein
MARFAFFRPDELGAGDAWRRENGAIRFERAAREKDYGQRGYSPDRPQDFIALTAQPFDWPQDSHVPTFCQKSKVVTTHFFGQT